MQKTTKKRYYKVGESVYIKKDNVSGTIKELNIDPKANTYKAVVQVKEKLNQATIITNKEYDLWEIGKNKRHIFKELNKNTPTILFAKVRESAIIPSKDEENGGYDIYANFDEDYMIIHPQQVVLVPTGVASSVTDDWVLIVKERGSTGSKAMSVRAGVIDSSYRGEIFVALNNTNENPIVIAKKHVEVEIDEKVIVYPYEKAIAQLLMLPVPKARVKEISYEDLKAIPSKRGTGALGSSNK